MSVVVVTMPNDYHAHAVQWAIRRLGGECELFYPADLCDGATWTWPSGKDFLNISYKGTASKFCFEDCNSIWMRRPVTRIPQEALSDVLERSASECELQVMVQSAINVMERGRFVVNSHKSTQTAALKPYQFSIAEEVKLKMPETIVSNSKDDIIDFIRSLDGPAIYKPLKGTLWYVGEKENMAVRMAPTTLVTPDLIAAADMAPSPGIFQEHIDKVAEIRATFIGRTVFAWEKRFSSRSDVDVDWRFVNRDATLSVTALPQQIVDQCFELMRRLGLIFGCFDFAVSPTGEHYFLEVNPQGQWLWGDTIGLGINQLEAMAEFLLSRDPEFVWSGRNELRLRDFRDGDHDVAVIKEKEHHYGDLLTFLYGAVSVKTNPTIPVQVPVKPSG